MSGFRADDLKPPLELGEHPFPTKAIEPDQAILGKLAVPKDVEISEPDEHQTVIITFYSILEGHVARRIPLQKWYEMIEELGHNEGLSKERRYALCCTPFTKRSITRILPVKIPMPRSFYGYQSDSGPSKTQIDSNQGVGSSDSTRPPTLSPAPRYEQQENGQVEEEIPTVAIRCSQRNVTRSERSKNEAEGMNRRSNERVSVTMGRNPVKAAPVVVSRMDDEDDDEDETPTSTSGTAEERGNRKSKKERKKKKEKKKKHHRHHREERSLAEDGARTENEAQAQPQQVANETERQLETQESLPQETTSEEQEQLDHVSGEPRRSMRKRPRSPEEHRPPIDKMKIRRTGTYSMKIVKDGEDDTRENPEEAETNEEPMTDSVGGQLPSDHQPLDTAESLPIAEMSVSEATADVTEERQDAEHNKTAASPVETGTAERSLPRRGKSVASTLASTTPLRKGTEVAATSKSGKQTKQKEKNPALNKATKTASNKDMDIVQTYWHSADYDSVNNEKLDTELIGNPQKTFESITSKTHILKEFYKSDKEWMASIRKEKQKDHRDAVTVKYVNELSTHYAEARNAYPSLDDSPLPLIHFGEAEINDDLIHLPRSNFYLTRHNMGDKIPCIENYKQIKLGQVVWSKFGKEFWPGIVEGVMDLHADNAVFIRWMNENRFSQSPYEHVWPFDYTFHLNYNPKKKDIQYQDSVAKAILINGLVGYWEPFMKEHLFHRMAAHVEFHGMLSHIPGDITKELLNLPHKSGVYSPWDFTALEKSMSFFRIVKGEKKMEARIPKVARVKIEALLIKFYIIQRRAFPCGKFFPTSWKMLIQFLENEKKKINKNVNERDRPGASGNADRLTDEELEQAARPGNIPGLKMEALTPIDPNLLVGIIHPQEDKVKEEKDKEAAKIYRPYYTLPYTPLPGEKNYNENIRKEFTAKRLLSEEQ